MIRINTENSDGWETLADYMATATGASSADITTEQTVLQFIPGVEMTIDHDEPTQQWLREWNHARDRRTGTFHLSGETRELIYIDEKDGNHLPDPEAAGTASYCGLVFPF